MSAHVATTLRFVAKTTGWAILAVVGVIAMLLVGWVPAELAAMLGSRRRNR